MSKISKHAALGSISGNNIGSTIELIEVDRLLLDIHNPRLATGASAKSQFELVKRLWTEMAVKELALSIAHNGFFPEEPLFVIPEHARAAKSKRYVVVEGNRRLAAVLLLRNKRLREKIRATDIPKLSQKKIQKLDRLPVSVYPNR